MLFIFSTIIAIISTLGLTSIVFNLSFEEWKYDIKMWILVYTLLIIADISISYGLLSSIMEIDNIFRATSTDIDKLKDVFIIGKRISNMNNMLNIWLYTGLMTFALPGILLFPASGFFLITATMIV